MSVPYYRDDAITLHHGNAYHVVRDLPDGSVDCCVTSPPYFGLRDYGVEGQIGAESSPAEFVERLRVLFAEVRRVLADDGTLWLNLGDTYVDKVLLGIPWQVAFALGSEGWIRRAEVIWAKRNLKPENVTDRPTQAHEQVFLFTKQRRGYWYDADAIREESDPDQEAHNQRYAKEYVKHTARAALTGQPGNVNNVGIHSRPGKGGRNARSVWRISATPTPGAHFAVMPLELAERCVRAGCKPGGTVLDPFNGSGTTGLAATRNGRKYVGIDLNADYLDLSLRTRLAQSALLDEESA